MATRYPPAPYPDVEVKFDGPSGNKTWWQEKPGDRIGISALFVFLFVMVAPTVLVAAGGGFLTAWLIVAGVHDVRGILWGWLCTRAVNSKGRVVYPGLAGWVPLYYLSAATAWLAYVAFVEGTYALFRSFKRSLSGEPKPDKPKPERRPSWP